mmetsp:Transcript_6317/g.15656  ORF Transcript_6317/g.15656 Transcript_6317/m.15656 type:complete len:209 (-) Transcript_6317:719-1345(-)
MPALHQFLSARFGDTITDHGARHQLREKSRGICRIDVGTEGRTRKTHTARMGFKNGEKVRFGCEAVAFPGVARLRPGELSGNHHLRKSQLVFALGHHRQFLQAGGHADQQRHADVAVQLVPGRKTREHSRHHRQGRSADCHRGFGRNRRRGIPVQGHRDFDQKRVDDVFHLSVNGDILFVPADTGCGVQGDEFRTHDESDRILLRRCR